jgi:hypothetical protein
MARRWATIKSNGGNPGLWLGLERAVASRLVFSKWRAAVGGAFDVLSPVVLPFHLKLRTSSTARVCSFCKGTE